MVSNNTSEAAAPLGSLNTNDAWFSSWAPARACHAMSVTVALATSTLARPVQTVLRYALRLPQDVSSVSVEHCWAVGAVHTRPRLRSTSTTDFSLPRLRTKFGERSFSHAGPSAWNDLPEDLRAVADSAKFRQQLKTYFLLELLMFSDFRPSVFNALSDSCNVPMLSMFRL